MIYQQPAITVYRNFHHIKAAKALMEILCHNIPLRCPDYLPLLCRRYGHSRRPTAFCLPGLYLNKNDRSVYFCDEVYLRFPDPVLFFPNPVTFLHQVVRNCCLADVAQFFFVHIRITCAAQPRSSLLLLQQ